MSIQKRFNKCLLITLASMAVSTVPSLALAADGTIQFTGEVRSNLCTVDTGSISQTVSLGKVSKTAFSATGNTAAATSFSIKFSACSSDINSVQIRFDGTASANKDVLALNGAGDEGIATNLGIGIYEKDSATPLSIATKSKQIDLDTTDGATNTLTYIAKYVALADSVGAGTANATATFTVIYP